MLLEVFRPKTYAKKLGIILAVYNEQENICRLVEKWSKLAKFCDGSLVVLNDGCQDESLKLLRSTMSLYDNLIVMNKDHSGYDYSCLQGMRWAIANGFEWICVVDNREVEGSEFLRVWEEERDCDFIFSVNKNRKEDFSSKVFTTFLQIILKIVFRIDSKDFFGPFKFMKGELVKKILPDIPTNEKWPSLYLMLFILKSFPVKWIEIEVKPISNNYIYHLKKGLWHKISCMWNIWKLRFPA